jgi:hypothetical protein
LLILRAYSSGASVRLPGVREQIVHCAAYFKNEVVFGDGGSFSPPTRHVFAANTRSHVIDLPGARRLR